MRYSFRLAEVVGHVPDPRRRPGTIKAICEYTGLDRHQVAALLKNEVKYIPLDALSKLCELPDRPRLRDGRANCPAGCSAWSRSTFGNCSPGGSGWSCAWACGAATGERRSTTPGSSRPTRCCWANCSTASRRSAARCRASTRAAGLGTMATTAAGSQACLPANRPASGAPASNARLEPGPGARSRNVSAMARAVVRQLLRSTPATRPWSAWAASRAIRSSRLLLASAFGCEPFESQDEPAGRRASEAARSSCATATTIRSRPRAAAACGSPQRRPATKPGIYYEQASGKWDCCPWDADTARRGVRVLHPSRIAGPHGNGARRFLRPGDAAAWPGCLARRGEEFWPPCTKDTAFRSARSS